MESVSNFCAILCVLFIFSAPIALVIWLILLIKKSEKRKAAKKLFFGTLIGIVASTLVGAATSSTEDCTHQLAAVSQIAPTCTTEGTITYQCQKCDFVETKVVPSLEHTYTERILQASSCTAEGALEKTCSACGKQESAHLPKIPHAYKITSITEATFEISGVEESTCSVCGEVFRKEIGKIGTKENPGKITVDALVAEIQNNKQASAAKYNEQWIEISGKVLETGHVAGMTRFCIYGGTNNPGLRIVCWVNEEIAKPFEYQGQIITFLGQVREITTVNATEIGECQIISK